MQVVAAGRLEQRKAAENRIVTMIDGFDANHRHSRLITGVITGPFTKRSFRHEIIWQYFAFDRYLGVGGERQSSDRPFDDAERFTGNPAGVGVLVHFIRNVSRSDQKINRVMAEGDSDGQRFSILMVFVTMDAAMLTWRHVQTEMIATMDHDAIGSDIDPIFFRVARYDEVVCANVSSTIKLMPARHGKFKYVDVAAFLTVFK